MRRFSGILCGILMIVMLAGCGVNWTEITGIEGSGDLTEPASIAMPSEEPSASAAPTETDPPAVTTTEAPTEPATEPPSVTAVPTTAPDPADIDVPESFPLLSLLKDPQRFSIPETTEPTTEAPTPTPEQTPWSPGYSTQIPGRREL